MNVKGVFNYRLTSKSATTYWEPVVL